MLNQMRIGNIHEPPKALSRQITYLAFTLATRDISRIARLVFHPPHHQHNRRCGELPLLESRLVGTGVDRERRSKQNWIFRAGIHIRFQRRQVRGENRGSREGGVRH